MRRVIPHISMALALALFAVSCSIPTVQPDDAAAGPAEATTVPPAATTDRQTESDTDGTARDGDQPADGPANCSSANPTEIALPGTTARFFATCGGSGDAPYPIHRSRDQYSLNDKLTMMTKGLTSAEQSADLFSWFEPDDGIAVEAEVDGDGIASLRFTTGEGAWIPSASTSAEIISLVDPIAATVFASSNANGIDLDSLCFGQVDCGGVLTRAAFEQQLFLNHGVVNSGACGFAGYWDRPDACSISGLAEPENLRDATVAGVAADDTLNLRAASDADAFIISNSLKTGMSVQATDVVRLADDGGLWRLIFQDEETAGWVNNTFLTLELNEQELIAERFVAFVDDPSTETLATANFAEEVQLGLGQQLLVTVDRSALVTANTWVMDEEYFRAYVGPFSIIEPLQRVSRWEAKFGMHKHCAGDPMPVPAGLEQASIISIQPAEVTIDSCLQWFAVDLFVDEQGRIVAVTFDTWEP